MPPGKQPTDGSNRDRVIGFLRLLWAVEHALLSASKAMERRFGVTSQQRFAINLIGENPGISPGELAELFRVDPSSMSGILRTLEDRQYVRRLRDSSDRRKARLELSAAGRQIDAIRGGTTDGAVARALNAMSDQDLAIARNVLAAMERELLRVVERPVEKRGPAAVALRSASGDGVTNG